MKVQVEFQLDIIAKATYRNENLNLSVSGIMPISEGSERTSTSTVEGASEKVQALFQKAFEALIAEKQAEVVRLTRVQASESLAVAARMGEI